jgi:predicted dehydrogenase
MAMRAGKAVYVEKPCGTTPAEGEILVAVQRETGRVVQMGNQQRSAPPSIEVIGMIRDGLVGRPYLARTWYANTRGSIGRGAEAPVPDWLDYELWQGPAPRTPYRDNVIHYNWHWFHRWGTGEICNNGTHEIDVARWALGVEFPTRVTSSGGRYHFDDDWEFADTQVTTFEFGDRSQITWEGRSCNGMPIHSRGRGTAVHGESGTVIVDRSGYVAYDLDNREIARRIVGESADALDTRGSGDLTDAHVANFLGAIRGTDTLTAPIDDAARSVLLCHLGNIAQDTGRVLRCDPSDGRILDDPDAMARWERTYEPGWEISSL